MRNLRGEPTKEQVLEQLRIHWRDDQTLVQWLNNVAASAGRSIGDLSVFPDSELLKCIPSYNDMVRKYG